MSEDRSELRQSLLPSLLEAVQYNATPFTKQREIIQQAVFKLLLAMKIYRTKSLQVF